MAHRKLLVLTYHFPPLGGAGVFRTLGFVRHLPEFGWQTVVVAPPRLPHEPTDLSLLARVPPETAVYHAPYPDCGIWKLVHRLISPARIWLPVAAARCYQAIRRHRPDAVLTSGPPHFTHLLGRHLHRLTGLPWVADFRDPWVAGDRSPMSWKVTSRDVKDELSVMRESNAIVVNTPGSCELSRQAYPQYAAKITAITNGYDPEAFEVNPIPPLSGSTIEIVHTGLIYAKRSPGSFLEGIRRLDPSVFAGRTVRVRLIGDLRDKAQKAAIDGHIRAGLSADVSIEGRVPHNQSIRAMVEADVLLLLDSPGRQAGVPAKLYEYIGAGRPILALAESESDVAWALRESGLPHRIAPPLDADAIRTALAELLQDPATARCAVHTQRRARFTRKHLAGELAAVLDSCLERSSMKVGDRSLAELAR